MNAVRNFAAVLALSAVALQGTSAFAEEQVTTAAAEAPPVVTTQALQADDTNDPFEGSNRFFFGVNQVLDDLLLRPVAIAYRAVVPEFARNGVRNFLNNLNSPVIFANDLLQGDVDRAGDTLVRFGVNSTIGIGGLIDVGKEIDVPYHDEDFGQTLAVWGVNDGPYFYFPLMGPSSARDFTGFIVDRGLDPLTYVNWGNDDLEYAPVARTVLNVIDLRSRNIETLDDIERSSVDYYASIRSLYRQSRADSIRNGAPSSDLPDFDSGGGITAPSPISQDLSAE